jgi:acetylornithine deacetylase/succinyl-diaminopimelate desuccinylase-like protein
MYGGAVVNPAMALARILATMHDADGRIAIDGFYDAVRPFPDAVRVGMRALPFSDEGLMHEVGVSALGGEPGYTTLERLWTRPTCEVNGLLAAIPAKARKPCFRQSAWRK